MKYNYPVKYAAMPIIEQVGWSQGLNELERNYDVICYIVSKCYLLSDKTKYKENGKKEKEYEVVFPYQKGEYHSWNRVIPSFNVFNHTCMNSNVIEKVFDNYEEALEVATQKNKKLCEKTWIYLPYTEDLADKISKKREEFNDRLSRYKMLEQQILINTSDLEQSNIKELNKLIINNKDEMKILSSSLYEYLKCSSYSKFIVYSISPEQYDKLKVLINNQDISDILKVIENANPILYHEAKEKNIMVMDQNGNILYCINEKETLENNDEQKIPSIELNAIDSETSHIFTTEKLEDIVLSFKVHRDINLDKIQGPVLKKSLL